MIRIKMIDRKKAKMGREKSLKNDSKDDIKVKSSEEYIKSRVNQFKIKKVINN